MSTLMIIGLVLVAVAVFIAPLVWDLSRENNRLQTIADEADYFRMACNDASDGLLIQDMRGRIIWCNPAFCRIHGRPPDEVLGRNPQEFALPPEKTPPLSEIAQFRYTFDDPMFWKLQLFENQHKDGHLFWNQVSVSFKRFGDGREYAILVCRDVTEQIERNNLLRQAQDRLQKEATHDGLTDVANRSAFLSFISDALKEASEKPVGLLHIDLDEFKAINDTHGHSAGDAILVHIAKTLGDNIRASDLVARVGGDEFVVVCPNIANLEVLDRLAQTLSDEVATPITWSERLLSCKASIGAALATDSQMEPGDLLSQSDFALYEAKRKGRNQVALYDEGLHGRHVQQTLRASELASVIDTAAFDYFFQPQLSLETGRVTAFETLVRWNHPLDGFISPDEFLHIAKDLGILGTMDLHSMAAAIAQKAKLDATGFGDIGIAFNASPELLSHPEFVSRLIWGVEASGIDRGQVSIEVLETTQFGDAAETASHAAIISDLRAAGFQIQLDDFGKGFAGLTHLAQLDVTGVKIDRSLISNILNDSVSYKIVRKTIELSKDLGLDVVGEGVECPKIAAALKTMGCDDVQGFWLSEPLPAQDLDVWLRERDRVDGSRRA